VFDQSSLNNLGNNRISFTNSNLLDYRLRNKILDDFDYSSLSSISTKKNDVVFASICNNPVWIKRKINNTDLDIASTVLEELNNNNLLLDYFYKNGFFSLIPLIHFLREITSDNGYKMPSLKACFIIDDPNIRFLSYGYIKYIDLVSNAKIFNFHISLATIPLDLWWISKKSLKFFNNNKDYISLSIHGNNHLKEELLVNKYDGYEDKTIYQALKRICKFQKKYSYKIDKILVPPHGMASKKMLNSSAKLGLFAITVSRPYPWTDKYNEKQYEYFNDSSSLNFFPSDFVEGFSIIPRKKMNYTNNEILLSFFLNKPIILYSHMSDFRNGYSNLTEKAEYINSFEKVEWISLENISISNYAQKIENDVLNVLLFSNKVNLTIPENIKQIKVKIFKFFGNVEDIYLEINNSFYPMIKSNKSLESNIIDVNSNDNIEIQIKFTKENIDIKNPKFSIKPIIRRILTETRDRIHFF